MIISNQFSNTGRSHSAVTYTLKISGVLIWISHFADHEKYSLGCLDISNNWQFLQSGWKHGSWSKEVAFLLLVSGNHFLFDISNQHSEDENCIIPTQYISPVSHDHFWQTKHCHWGKVGLYPIFSRSQVWLQDTNRLQLLETSWIGM